MSEIRLQKYIAMSGVASRRACEDLIRNGRVAVNGLTVTELGTKVVQHDLVEVDGRKVTPVEKKVHIMLNKPEGYVTTVKDQFSRDTVMDLVKEVKERIYPVGRLDCNTSGLLLLTNDGDFAFKLMHPGHGITKTYIVEIKGELSKENIKNFQNGYDLGDFVTAPARVRQLDRKTGTTVMEITIHEGKNRQIRRMCEAAGHTVLKLKRISIGSIRLGDLPEGRWRYLGDDEVNTLLNQVSTKRV